MATVLQSAQTIQPITVRTWDGKSYLTLEDGYFTLYWLKEKKQIPFSQVISFSLKDPKSKMRPGMITIQLGGGTEAVWRVSSFLSVCDSSNVEFPHAYEYLEAGREMQRQFIAWQSQKSTQENGYSVADEIRKFKELLDEGIITDDEFVAKKKQLLGI